MVAYAPYVTGTASLNPLYHALPTIINDCQVATVTIYQYAETGTTNIKALPTTQNTIILLTCS